MPACNGKQEVGWCTYHCVQHSNVVFLNQSSTKLLSTTSPLHQPNISNNPKSNYRNFPELTIASFANKLRPNKFTDVHFKRWEVKVHLCLTSLKVYEVNIRKPEIVMSDEDNKIFEEGNISS